MGLNKCVSSFNATIMQIFFLSRVGRISEQAAEMLLNM